VGWWPATGRGTRSAGYFSGRIRHGLRVEGQPADHRLGADRPSGAPLIRPTVFHAAALLWTLATLLVVGVLAASVTELVLRVRRARGWSGCN
jgi:hypothetical protein